ncbi:TIGR02099 family protein [Pseudoalteromonas shioyasakiensis]|uniref:YhdP family protein n=1 Tax=Pseudoalteromonas shioyasakiensis TaxID=1190813 RepID=UPI00211994D7|nr:YhdP family protein [Pseudoalteromonas shioyasakiensis]MCQ8879144.1 TIGR02099 family protein [Pseudoalteromonas shioyasakiensis]
MKAKTVCFFCLRKLWQVCAITLVLLAVIVSVLKYTLPYANDYKGDLEGYLYEKFAVNLSIGEISASWQGKGPAIVMEQISFEDNTTSPIALTIAKASLELNLWETIKTRQLKSNYFVINGFHADVDLPTMLDSSGGEVSFEQKELIEGLFLGETGHFAVENSSLNFLLADGKERRLILENIVWQNSPEQHSGSGTLALPGISVGTFDARLTLTGATLESMAGDIYVQARDVDVSKWLAQYSNKDKHELKSDLNLESWFSIEKGLITDVKVKWLPSSINWLQGEKQQAQQISLSEGGFHLYPWQQGWRLKSTGLAMSNKQHRWPDFQFEAQLEPRQKQLWFSQLDFDLVNQLAQLSSFSELEPLISRQPNGQVDQAYVHYAANTDWQLWFSAQNVGWLAQQGIPGAKALRVEGIINQERGRVSLFGENNQLLTADTFSRPISYNQLNLDIDLAKTAQGWQISSDNLWLDNDEVTLAAEMKVTLGESPRFDLYGEVFAPDASIARHYFPLPVMRDSLVDYLTGAIKGGELTQAQVLFSGPVTGFPFADNSGQFEVLAQVDNANYQFSPDWPAVTQGSAKLHFVNERMDIYTQQGNLVNLAVGAGVHVSIADLMNADVLTVKINKRASAEKLLPFFQATPLAEPLANVFSVIQGQGSANAAIELTVNLNELDVNAKGIVNLKDMPVFIAQPGLQLEGVSGRLYFNDDHIELKNAKANWLGMPLTFDFNGKSIAQSYRGDINITAQLNADTLIAHGQGLLKGYLQGEAEVGIKLGLNFLPDSFNYRANVTSELVGLSSQLPAPYAKSSQQAWPLSAQVQGDDISNLITASINKQLYFNGILANANGKMSNAHLILGEQDLGLNRDDLSVSINLDETPLLPWLGLIEQIIDISQMESQSEGFLPPLKEVVGQINQLSIDDIVFNDFEMRLVPSQNELDLRLNAKELRSQITIPLQQHSRPIQINSDYLRVNFKPEQVNEQSDSAVKQSVEQLSWLNDLPAIEFECADCKIASYQLDKVSASFYGDGKKLSISEIVVDKGEHILRAKGQWQSGLTQLSGHMHSDDIGELFDEFDITTTVKDSTAQINFDLAWQAAPYQFDIPSLAGNLAWDLGDGHLAEISDGGARVFSLLSLDSLVRKLKLDFRDVFSKGFFYNNFQGTMQLDKGIAYTQDTKMDGVPADLTIKGHTNLNTMEINYDLAVAPQVTSSIPVIVAWMVNPVTGLAALAIDKVIHSARVISEINFKVTGSMSDPVVQEVDRKSREVTIPQAAQNQPQATSGHPELNLKDAAATATQ